MLLSIGATVSRRFSTPRASIIVAASRRRLLRTTSAFFSTSIRKDEQQQQAGSNVAVGDEGSNVIVERRPISPHAGVLVVTLNRPKQSNAMSTAILQDLQGIFDTLGKYVYPSVLLREQ